MSHAPKQRALEAYAAGLLSPRATARIESHLSDCALCKQTLAAVRTYGLLREEAARSSAPALNWERLAAALDAHTAAKPAARPAARSRGKVVALAWPLLAVAAALMIAWLGRSGAPFQASAPISPRPSEPVAVATAAVRIGRVSMVVGGVEQGLGSERTPVTLASEIREGSTVTTGPNAALHVILADGTGFALGPDSSLRIDQLREDTTLLALASGSLSNQVHKLTSGQRYEIAAGDLSARVRGTRFRVERDAAVRVTVHEGKVEVARGDEVLALLRPGESYQAPKPATSTEQAAPELPVHGVVALAPGWATLQLPPMAELHAWIIDGARVSTQGDLSMRLPRGATQLSFEDGRGQIRSVQLDLREALTRLEPAALAKLIAPKEARVGYLAPEEIAKVVKAGIDPLRRCYERGLRVVPSLAGKLTLAMRVAADGHVLRADPKAGSELPVEIEHCISQEAMRMVFPKPEGGGAVTFEVPLNLKSSR